jgi:LmbE family N-acetylglucosaminyl deacetylase
MKIFQKAVVLAPHTDDGELGCGGTIAKLLELGIRVVYFGFSAAEESVPKHLPSNILRTECFRATALLGIPASDCRLFNYKVRNFPSVRQEILDNMVQINREIEPDLVFVPSRTDTHQDHSVISREGYRAFKRKTIFSYELPWNTRHFDATCLIRITDEQMEKKLASVAEYKSQQGRDYTSPEAVLSLARVRGQQAGCKFAEAFEVQRMVF